MFKSSFDKNNSRQKDAEYIAGRTSSRGFKKLWRAIGHGNYNRVWRSLFPQPANLVSEEPYAGPWVLKYAIIDYNPIANAMNEPNRAVRLWNEINHTTPKAGPYEQGWVAPYLENSRQSTDDEISQKLIEIYCDTRRITIDAATEGNFLTDLNTGEVILVDVDLALKRSTSEASLNFGRDMQSLFSSYWTNPKLQRTMPQTLNITRNLLFLEDNVSMDLIDKLCEDNLITLKNIQSLTWFRENKITLTSALFRNMVIFEEHDPTILSTTNSDHSTNSQNLSYQALTSKSSPSFFPSQDQVSPVTLLNQKKTEHDPSSCYSPKG